MHRSFATAALAALVLALTPAATQARTVSASGASQSVAIFEGGQIDLSHGWGDAKACVVHDGGNTVECFRDRASLLVREDQLQSRTAAAPTTATTTCSTPLRLFADSNYGGRELDFYDRGYWQNLSTWSFDNQLSSYKVGGCAVYLADGANGGGSWYPGNATAGHWEPAMVSGWNDRISSIYIQ
jgi:hypothetical protein